MTSIYHSGNAERQVNFVTDNQYQELLTGASYPAFGRSFTFGLDALGRRITDQNISNNALHVRTYAFDPMSRLSAVSSVKAPLPNAEPWPAEELEYSYLPGSPLRRTLTKQQPAQTTRRHFIWDGANELESLSEFTASGNTDYFAEIFLSDPAIMDKRFGAAKNQNAFLDEGAEGIDYITDQQNTINASYKDSNITDEQHFSPYGQPVTFTLPEGTELTKFAYTGRNYDAPADLYYYRGRYYDACSARFLNPDPIENRLNWTGYVGGDPVNMVDPSGYVGIIFEGYENYTQEDWQRIADESEKRRQESSENFAQAMDSWVGKLVMGYAGGNLIKGLKLFDRFRKKAPDSNQCLPSNESQLNNPLEEIIKRTRKIDGRLETSLDDGSKIIFRRDIGQNAHPIGKKYQNPVDHFNIEIHKPVKNHLGRFKQTKDVHIIVNDKLEVIDVIMK
jgi:RHS repeat-associated protein